MFSPNFKNTAFFSTCNDAYIPNSITALLSIRQFHHDAKLFIFSRNISTTHQQILRKLDIGFFDLDLRGKFNRHWNYPVECYYLFAGPEKLLSQGFKYSVYIDGDTLCLHNPLLHIGRIRGVAGVAVGNCRGVFLNDFEPLKNLFNLNQKQTNRPRIASGIVFFNNSKMHSINFLNTAEKYFKKCLANQIPRKGDDSLFSLIQLINLKPSEVKNLGTTINYMPTLFGKQVPQNTVFFHFVEHKPWNDCPNNAKYYNYIKHWRKIFKQNFTPTWDKEYRQKISEHQATLEKTENKRLLNLSKSGLVLTPQQKLKNSAQKPIKIFVSENLNLGLTNFGDEVQKDIIPIIFGYRIQPYSEAHKAELFSVGSILFELPNMNLKNHPHIWGSGFISNKPVKNENVILPKIHFNAVRGKTTLERIKPFIKKTNLPLGDPGLLANIIYPKNPHKTERIGVVPHYVDADNPLVEQIRHDNRFLVIDPLDTPRQVARQISSCKLILSSSLHGLIFADSYGIPNAHIHFSDKVYGGEYKFDDYDSAIGKKHLHADINKIFDFSYLASIQKQYKPIKNLTTIQKNLIKSFPHF